MGRHDDECEATIVGAFGITPCKCVPRGLLQWAADVIRREVRLSSGIPEGQEFRCDWMRVAEAVIGAPIQARP